MGSCDQFMKSIDQHVVRTLGRSVALTFASGLTCMSRLRPARIRANQCGCAGSLRLLQFAFAIPAAFPRCGSYDGYINHVLQLLAIGYNVEVNTFFLQ